MKGCPNYPEYNCEAFDGLSCKIIDAVDEPCYYQFAKDLHRLKIDLCSQWAIKRFQDWKCLE